VDALNVFPVPDGDTGTNMRLTIDAALRALDEHPSSHAGVAANRAAEAALLGARGNSGVILSQLLGGVASALKDAERLDAAGFAAACEEAVRRAYRAVAQPVEGTMLTTSKDVAIAVRAAAARGADLRAALSAAVEAADRSVRRTPELLPTLRDAGVVDAGAEGLAVILRGMLRYVHGDSVDEDEFAATVHPDAAVVAQRAHVLDDHGYCTNFVVRGADLDLDQLRAAILALGNSAVVAGGETLIKVHVHTDHPGQALEAGAQLGELTAIEIANMRDQVSALHGDAGQRNQRIQSTAQTSELGLVAVAPSDELAAIFKGFGAVTVRGGQTMNPSVAEIRDAIVSTHAAKVLVLPNNGNVILTATEAGQLAGRPVTILPTSSIPQGVAAAVAYLPERTIEDNAESMQAAARAVTTIEVTTAPRGCTLDGKEIGVGTTIALVDGTLAKVGSGVEEVALAAIDGALQSAHSLITLYAGEDLAPQRAEAIAERLRERFPKVEVEVVIGGQPHYPIVAALE